jgi:hypothetical protein
MYAIAASAAGVGMLVGSQTAEGKIIYTKTRHVIEPNQTYHVDLDHDRVADFSIQHTSGCQDWCWSHLFASAIAGNAVLGKIATHRAAQPLAYALAPGAGISRKGPFSGIVMASYNCGEVYGQWTDVTNRHLGLRFKINGKTHYGWARFNVRVQIPRIYPTLTGYAYETIPNKTHHRRQDQRAGCHHV